MILYNKQLLLIYETIQQTATEGTMKKNHSKYIYHTATMAGKCKLTFQHYYIYQ